MRKIITNEEYNKKNTQALSKRIFVTITVSLMLSILSTISISSVSAQNQNDTLIAETQIDLTGQNANASNTKSFKVTFDSLIVNTDHDPITAGEWLMDVYVNNQILDLFPGSISVNDGDTVFFDTNNVVNITVPNDQTGFIRIGTVGWENDVGFEPLPVFFSLMDTRVPFYIYNDLIQQAVAPYVGSMSPNDPNGYVAVQYDQFVNFGVGIHSVCSERNTVATVPTPFDFDECDYIINFTIEEINQQ